MVALEATSIAKQSVDEYGLVSPPADGEGCALSRMLSPERLFVCEKSCTWKYLVPVPGIVYYCCTIAKTNSLSVITHSPAYRYQRMYFEYTITMTMMLYIVHHTLKYLSYCSYRRSSVFTTVLLHTVRAILLLDPEMYDWRPVN